MRADYNKKFRQYKTLHEKVARWEREDVGRGPIIKKDLLLIRKLVNNSLSRLRVVKPAK